jgi:hypothetical protein
MPEVHLSALTSIDGDDPADAATAHARGWRIDEDYWWVRPLKGNDPTSPPGDGHFRVCHVFAACAAAALAFDRHDLTYECKAHT